MFNHPLIEQKSEYAHFWVFLRSSYTIDQMMRNLIWLSGSMVFSWELLYEVL